MKGNQKVIESLKGLLSEELAAICQYMVQAEMCQNMGFKKIHDALRAQAMDEMKHAEKLIERTIFLEGMPDVAHIGKVKIGKNVEDLFSNDISSESSAIHSYNAAIGLAIKNHDEGTAELLRAILKDEEKHQDWLETQTHLILQLGLEKYLAEQVN